MSLSNIETWAYQLQNADPVAVAASNLDLIVTDYSRDGSQEGAYTLGEVASMKSGGREAIAYLSIGEAEDYRFYWEESWNDEWPSWIAEENPDWPGNYKVEYWNTEWQAITLSYLDKIIEAGFTGAYLDIVDAYQYFEDSRPTAAQEMIAWVQTISAHAKAINPDFHIIVQNAEELLADSAYLSAIDAVGKEDLYFGIDGDGVANDPESVAYSASLLAAAQAAGKQIFLIEYLELAAQVVPTALAAGAQNYLTYIAARELDRLDFTGTQGGDSIVGSNEDNRMFGLAGADTLLGAMGDDTLTGHGGEDQIYGNRDDDLLQGKGGNDQLFGGKENDTLNGGAGDDLLRGGLGADLFMMSLGSDQVIGFDGASGDRILAAGYSLSGDAAGNAVLSIDGGSLTLVGIVMESWNAAWAI